MNEAMDKLREAVAAWNGRTNFTGSLLYVTGLGGAVVTAAEAVLASPPVVLTEAERETVAQCRAICDYTAYGGSVRAMLAIIDRIAPKPVPAHKPCAHCNGEGRVCGDGAIQCKECLCICGSWEQWDRRVEVKP